MLALTSRIGKMKPDGAPFKSGLSENEYWVFDMQIGRSLKPLIEKNQTIKL